MSNFTDEDVEGLKAMNFSDTDIEKLLNLTPTQISGMLKKPRKKSVRSKTVEKVSSTLKAKKGKHTITYYVHCKICGSFKAHTEEVKALTYRTLNFRCREMTTEVEVDSCKECRGYLRSIDHESLIDIILKPKHDRGYREPIPQVRQQSYTEPELGLWKKEKVITHGSELVLMSDHIKWTKGLLPTTVHTMNTSIQRSKV